MATYYLNIILSSSSLLSVIRRVLNEYRCDIWLDFESTRMIVSLVTDRMKESAPILLPEA